LGVDDRPTVGEEAEVEAVIRPDGTVVAVRVRGN
jgi:hypothetical protein